MVVHPGTVHLVHPNCFFGRGSSWPLATLSGSPPTARHESCGGVQVRLYTAWQYIATPWSNAPWFSSSTRDRLDDRAVCRPLNAIQRDGWQTTRLLTQDQCNRSSCPAQRRLTTSLVGSAAELIQWRVWGTRRPSSMCGSQASSNKSADLGGAVAYGYLSIAGGGNNNLWHWHSSFQLKKGHCSGRPSPLRCRSCAALCVFCRCKLNSAARCCSSAGVKGTPDAAAGLPPHLKIEASWPDGPGEGCGLRWLALPISASCHELFTSGPQR